MEQALLVSPPLGGTRSGSSPALFAGRYRVQHLLGRVGTAQLHQGWDELLERPVTVKVFDHAADTSGGDSWDQPELQHLAGLSHPGLITVLDAGTEQPDTAAQRSFLVLERVRGTTLLRRLTRGPLPAELVAEIGQQLATTLAYLHQDGLVHVRPVRRQRSGAAGTGAIRRGVRRPTRRGLHPAQPRRDTHPHTLTITGGHVTTLHWDKP